MLLKYGTGEVKLELPKATSTKVISGSSSQALADPQGAVKNALQQPVASPPLQGTVEPGETVCILVNDATRAARSEVFLPPLIETLVSAGVNKKDIFIVFTNGSHRTLASREMKDLVGKEVASEVAMFNHDCRDMKNHIDYGFTRRGTPVHVNKMVVQADRRILTGSVVHHFFAGFGGGRKALIPGVAGWETIQKNHSLLFDKRAQSGRLEGNPVHEDLLEAAFLAGGGFLLNTVLNEKNDISGVFAGNMVKAHLQACSLVDKINGVFLENPADVVIASCGGHPKDINLYQAHKTLDNTIRAMKPGGSLILLAKCPEGIGSENYEKWASKHLSLQDLETKLKAQFELGGHKAYTVAKLLQKGKVYLLADLPPERAEMLGFIPVTTLDEAFSAVYRGKTDPLTYIFPRGDRCLPSVGAFSE
ncbi:MAG: nickel-dependent lactate racemase [Bacillota bacterium]